MNTASDSLPLPDQLGPDPEPPGVRGDWLLEQLEAKRAPKRINPPDADGRAATRAQLRISRKRSVDQAGRPVGVASLK